MRLALNSLCSIDRALDYLMCMGILCVCKYECLPCAGLAPWSSEEGIRSLELVFETIVSHCVDAGDRTWVLSKSIQCS